MRFFGALFLIAVTPGILAAFIASGSAFLHSSCLWSVLAGFIVGLLLDYVLLKRVPGLETFEHELTHAVAALMFFRRVTGFVVTRHEGGTCGHSGGFGGRLGDDFIGLAPYVLPTFTFLLVAIRPLLPQRLFPWFDIGIGLTFGYHLLSTVRETKEGWHTNWFASAGDGELSQTDLGSRGLFFSVVYIFAVSLAILGLLSAVVALGYSGIVNWAKCFWHAEVLSIGWAVHKLARAVGRGRTSDKSLSGTNRDHYSHGPENHGSSSHPRRRFLTCLAFWPKLIGEGNVHA
jgi:hypothetical protein